MANVINIYTDGACSGNQYDENIGGWGAILEYGVHKKELHGGEKNTTNNRMELTALIRGLEALNKTGYAVNVFSDSSYIMNCLSKRWYENWRKNGWKTSAKKPVENRDLWEKVLSYIESYDFRYYLVKGHVSTKASAETLQKNYEKFKGNNGNGFSYDEYLYITEKNNRADELANVGMDEIR
ncbi:MAG: ribonuclease HI [Clostridiales Family XIII bacterium]|jgi:ribonuclease HI|nr:ribonuclease HI [Clostridiales Family XIII bacterium]